MSGNMPWVTIVTPVYNQAEYLAETITSVLDQTYLEIEYIVIDDGSTDETPRVADRYANRLQFLRQSNIGQAATLNKGWAMARGKYIGYLSSDDLLLPHAVARLVAVLEAEPDVVCVFPNSDLIDFRSRVIRRAVCRPFDLETAVVEPECYVGPGALFRRSAFDVLGGWRLDMQLAPDREFWIRLASHGRFVFLRESLALYRTHPAATSFRAATEEVSQEYLRVLDSFFGGIDIPAALHRRRGEAYGNTELLLARNALWRGEFESAMEHYHNACRHYSPLRGWRTLMKLLRRAASKPLKAIYARVMGAFL